MRQLTVPVLVLTAALAAAPAIAAADPVGTEPSPAPAATDTAAPAATDTDAPAAPATDTATPATPAAPATSAAPATPAGKHQVTYTVSTTSDLTANIYFVTADPPNQSAANDPTFMPMARTPVGPGAPWTYQTALDDPTRWAFVSASGGLRVNPEFRCEIAVDGQVVVTQQGGSGVQCSLRPW